MNAKIEAAEVLEREATRVEGLMAAAKELREIGGLEDAIAKAKSDLGVIAHDAANIESQIASRRAAEDRFKKDMDSYRGAVERELADKRKAAEADIAQMKAKAEGTLEKAEEEAAKILADAKRGAEKAAADARARASADEKRAAEAAARLVEVEAQLTERQAALDTVNKTLAGLGAKT